MRSGRTPHSIDPFSLDGRDEGLVVAVDYNDSGRYDRMADDVERVTGRPAMSVRQFVALHADQFGGRRS